MLGQKQMFLFIDGGNTPYVLYSPDITLFKPLASGTTNSFNRSGQIGILTNKFSLNW